MYNPLPQSFHPAALKTVQCMSSAVIGVRELSGIKGQPLCNTLCIAQLTQPSKLLMLPFKRSPGSRLKQAIQTKMWNQ